MRNAERFNTTSAKRAYRNAKVIYEYAKFGKNGLSKVNPTLIYIDAVISLGELFVSYSEYRQVKEQNKRLEIEIETLSKEFSNLKKTLLIKEKKIKYELEKNSEFIEKKLKENRANSEILKKAYESAKKYFFQMKNELQQYKKEFPYSKETREMEKKYQEVMTLYIDTTIEFLGG